ncbi:hypothetical protein AB0J38_09785 [Streptomyces sp. NPDC050095]|uniref:hypothetical protein n=1 Tax=unclassified Streptomyces TaxID=2593676 RepID=UPI0034276402
MNEGDRFAQRRLRRNLLLFTAPIALVAPLVLVLLPVPRVWQAGMFNGGQQHAIVEQVAYALVPRGGTQGNWCDHHGILAEPAGRGLRHGTDFLLVQLGRGHPVAGRPVGSGERAPAVVDAVDALLVRVRVVDAAGDSHERIMDHLHGARLERPAGP